jgi:hypothetical protein
LIGLASGEMLHPGDQVRFAITRRPIPLRACASSSSNALPAAEPSCEGAKKTPEPARLPPGLDADVVAALASIEVICRV